MSVYTVTKRVDDRLGGYKISQVVVKSNTEAKAAMIQRQAACPCCGGPKFGVTPDRNLPFTQVKNFYVEDVQEWLYWQMRNGALVEIQDDWYWDQD
jgi:hypothetical protein